MRIASWMSRRAAIGEARVQWLFRAISACWRWLLPLGVRRPAQKIGSWLQLDAALTPAVVSIAFYPVSDHISSWWSLVVYTALIFWVHALVRPRVSLGSLSLASGAWFTFVFLAPMGLAAASDDYYRRFG